MPSETGCPFNCPSHPADVNYAPGTCPRTDDVLSRAINISIGVQDPELGSAFGIRLTSTGSQISAALDVFVKSAREVL